MLQQFSFILLEEQNTTKKMNENLSDDNGRHFYNIFFLTYEVGDGVLSSVQHTPMFFHFLNLTLPMTSMLCYFYIYVLFNDIQLYISKGWNCKRQCQLTMK